MNSAILIHPEDNVAVVVLPVLPGQELVLGSRAVFVREPVPLGHKIAVQTIPAGAIVRRYGEMIGRAACAIEAGCHVHTHNLRYEEPAHEYAFPSGEIPLPQFSAEPRFLGYPRADGRVGTRNYIAVAAASNCSAHVVDLVARSFENEVLPPNVDGVVAFPHSEGCAHAQGPDTDQLHRTLAGVLCHPNVSGALLIGLGCEDNEVARYPVDALTLQQSGGTSATVAAARARIRELIGRTSADRRVPVPVSKLVVGLNCGGSDSFSGITANPALGVCSDLLVGLGATVVLAETPEIYGAEHLLAARARNRQVAEKLLSCVEDYKRYLNRFGAGFDANPSPGNLEGGITTILEKSLGAVSKAGTSPLTDVVGYAQPVTTPGFVFMNTPGYDPVSLAGLAAGGVNLIAFTTGRGSAIGFPTVPVVKIASNAGVWEKMRENLDWNAGCGRPVQTVGREIFDLLVKVASGSGTAAEALGHKEFVPWRIGPVL